MAGGVTMELLWTTMKVWWVVNMLLFLWLTRFGVIYHRGDGE